MDTEEGFEGKESVLEKIDIIWELRSARFWTFCTALGNN